MMAITTRSSIRVNPDLRKVRVMTVSHIKMRKKTIIVRVAANETMRGEKSEPQKEEAARFWRSEWDRIQVNSVLTENNSVGTSPTIPGMKRRNLGANGRHNRIEKGQGLGAKRQNWSI